MAEKYTIVLQIDGKDNASLAIDHTTKKVKELNDTAEKGKTAAKNFGESWENFKSHAQSFIGATALVGAAIGQIQALGRANIAAEITFNQVSDGADNAAASLARMRQLTGGVIADMDLMKGANSLLVTGVAQTNEQAEQLVNLGARLGSVMGVDATESIQNLNAALLNNSFLRLDTLGISAARVRERVNELKEAGLDMSAAFSQAVVEIGSQTLEDLGAAAGVAETAIGRLSTRAINFGQDVASIFSRGLETAATSLEQLIILSDLALGGTGGIPALEAQRAQYEALIPLARQYENAANMTLAPTTNNFMIEDATRYVVENPEMASMFATAGENAGRYFAEAFNGENPAMALEARGILEDAFNTDFSLWSDEQLAALAYEADVTFASAANAQEALRIETEQTTAAMEEQNRQMQAAADSDAFLIASTQTVNNLAEIQAKAYEVSDLFREGLFVTASGATFFDAEQLDEVQTETQAIVDEYERLKLLGETSEYTLVSEAEVERARIIAEEAERSAEQAERFATAFANASLAQLAGQTGGGRLNEFYQGVLGQIEDPELRAQAEQQFNLQSGVETAESQIIEYGQALTAAITEEFGVAAGMRAGEDFTRAFADGIAMGLSGEELQDYVEQEVGYALGTSADGGTSVGGEQITVQAGEGYNALSARTGYTVEELKAASGGDMLMAGEVLTVGNNQLIALDSTSTSSVLTAAGGNVMGQVAANTAQPMQIDYSQPNWWQYGAQYPDQMAAPATMSADDRAMIDEGELVNIQAAETSLATIAATDTSTTLDPMISDFDTINTELTEFESGMTRLTSTNFSLQIPLEFVLPATQIETIRRNSTLVEAVRLINLDLGFVQTT